MFCLGSKGSDINIAKCVWEPTGQRLDISIHEASLTLLTQPSVGVLQKHLLSWSQTLYIYKGDQGRGTQSVISHCSAQVSWTHLSHTVCTPVLYCIHDFHAFIQVDEIIVACILTQRNGKIITITTKCCTLAFSSTNITACTTCNATVSTVKIRDEFSPSALCNKVPFPCFGI